MFFDCSHVSFTLSSNLFIYFWYCHWSIFKLVLVHKILLQRCYRKHFCVIFWRNSSIQFLKKSKWCDWDGTKVRKIDVFAYFSNLIGQFLVKIHFGLKFFSPLWLNFECKQTCFKATKKLNEHKWRYWKLHKLFFVIKKLLRFLFEFSFAN